MHIPKGIINIYSYASFDFYKFYARVHFLGELSKTYFLSFSFGSPDTNVKWGFYFGRVEKNTDQSS